MNGVRRFFLLQESVDELAPLVLTTREPLLDGQGPRRPERVRFKERRPRERHERTIARAAEGRGADGGRALMQARHSLPQARSRITPVPARAASHALA